MIGRALGAGVPFAWVAGDTVYGNDRRLRRWLEEEGVSYVLAVKSSEPLWAATQDGRHRWRLGSWPRGYRRRHGIV